MKRSILAAGLVYVSCCACDAKEDAASADARTAEVKAERKQAEQEKAEQKGPQPLVARTPVTPTPTTPSMPTPTPTTPVTPEPMPASSTFAMIEPNTVARLAGDEGAKVWKLDSGTTWVLPEDADQRVEFATHVVDVGGSKHTLALWSFSSDYDAVHGALFSGKAGAWTKVWIKAELAEHDDAPDLFLPDVVQIGPARWAILHRPAGIGCGAEDCKPEDDYVDSALLEITQTGAVPIWTRNGPGCRPKASDDPLDFSEQKCLLAFEPGENEGVHDLVVELTNRNKRRAKTLRFVYDKDGYVEKN